MQYLIRMNNIVTYHANLLGTAGTTLDTLVIDNLRIDAIVTWGVLVCIILLNVLVRGLLPNVTFVDRYTLTGFRPLLAVLIAMLRIDNFTIDI